jgi:hypothetical protein
MDHHRAQDGDTPDAGRPLLDGGDENDGEIEMAARKTLTSEARLERPDRRPHIAARSVGCFCFRFSLIRQCAASGRNVRPIIRLLFHGRFSHISAGGEGRAGREFIGGGVSEPHHSRRGEIATATPHPLPTPSAA